jgi:hypothetical protein
MNKVILVAVLILATISATFADGDVTQQAGATAALQAFKDWSNYLLVTTTAALGWVASDKGNNEGAPTKKPKALLASAWFLCLSIIFGIFTLALIPLVLEKIPKITGTITSIYRIEAEFRLLWISEKRIYSATLKDFCWFQHLFFILGIVCYTWSKANPVLFRRRNDLTHRNLT